MNSATLTGGAVHVNGSIESANNYYTDNDSQWGGAVFIAANSTNNSTSFPCGFLSSTSDHYTKNNATSIGGAVYATGTISSTNNIHTNNNAFSGGAIYIFGESSYMSCNESKISSDHMHFEKNTAAAGAVLVQIGGKLKVDRSNIVNNFAQSRGVLYVFSVSLIIEVQLSFAKNHGSLFTFQQPSVLNWKCVLYEQCMQFWGSNYWNSKSNLIQQYRIYNYYQ